MALRCLDLSKFTEGSEVQVQEFTSDLLKALSETGFVKIVGHGMREQEVRQVFDWVCLMNVCLCLKEP